jgi:hypothetical protein
LGLFDIFSNDTAEQAARQRNAGLQQGYDALSGQYEAGRGAINAGYGTATGYYQPLLTSTGAGSSAYGDASGANGAVGTARAYDAFKNSGAYGGFKFANDMGLQAIARQHAAAGNPASGNADTDAAKFTAGLAGNTWKDYVSGLSPYLPANANAVGGAANIATGQGNALNANYTGQGNAANANYTGQGASNAAATMNNYNISKNLWDGLGKAVNVGSSLFGAFA